ncbi:MAG: biotin synthase BioB [bacterium]
MDTKLIASLEQKIEGEKPVSEEEALEVLKAPADKVMEILTLADRVRRKNFANSVHLCSITNAKSGACSEDCAFCAQSVHHQAEAEVYGIRPAEEMAASARQGSELPISHFGIVTSGPRPREDELEEIRKTILENPGEEVSWCASLGALPEETLRELKEAGLGRFHHNLETAPGYFDQICSTHSYEERVETVRTASRLGLEVCSGGILGMGENNRQRVEFARLLRELEVDSIPLNFLIPIPGTPLEEVEILEPREILKIIAMFRLVNPTAEIKVCAGRKNLRDLQSMIFYAGATGMMIGDLLTVAGRDVEEDLQMLDDLGLDYE